MCKLISGHQLFPNFESVDIEDKLSAIAKHYNTITVLYYALNPCTQIITKLIGNSAKYVETYERIDKENSY